MEKNVEIIADHREKISGLPELLIRHQAVVTFSSLKAGDYLLNNTLLVERKTAGDFVQSLLDGRLFNQCRKIRESGLSGLFIIEGNLDLIDRKISVEAIQGALLSIMVSWQLPVYFSSGKEETANVLMRICNFQKTSGNSARLHYGSGKKCHGSQIFFLQSLPNVGPQLALRLLGHFGTIEHIVTADVIELKSVEGVGKKKAEFIYNFFRKSYSCL